MNTRTQSALVTLKEHEAELRARGVSALYLFGSVARGEDRPDSDIDLFFDYDNPVFSLIDLATVQALVGDLLHSDVDVMTRGSLHPQFRRRVESEAIRVF